MCAKCHIKNKEEHGERQMMGVNSSLKDINRVFPRVFRFTLQSELEKKVNDFTKEMSFNMDTKLPWFTIRLNVSTT